MLEPRRKVAKRARIAQRCSPGGTVASNAVYTSAIWWNCAFSLTPSSRRLLSNCLRRSVKSRCQVACFAARGGLGQITPSLSAKRTREVSCQERPDCPDEGDAGCGAIPLADESLHGAEGARSGEVFERSRVQLDRIHGR